MPTLSKRIRIIETGKVYMSARIAARAIGGDFSKIYACLRGDRYKHKGFTFEYVED